MQNPACSRRLPAVEFGVLNQLEKTMNMNKILAAVAIVAASGSALAQQTEFVAADANFKSSVTRAEVRQELAQAYAEGNVVQRQHDGQDTHYAASPQTREQVRKEAARAAQTRHAGDVNDLYFGA